MTATTVDVRIGRHTGVAHPVHVDARALAAELAANIEGEVRFDDGSRAVYSRRMGSNYRQIPIGVVVPRNERDVIETVAACRRHRRPVLSRGCGTSLAGQCCNVAVIIDFTKYLHDIIEIDAEKKLARVHPGVVCQDLRSTGGQAWVDVWAGPGDASLVHGGRNVREQFVRGALGDGGADGGRRRGAGNPAV